MEHILNLLLNSTLFILATYVAYRYISLSQREESLSPTWGLMTGVFLAALGTAMLRVYWLPWYWLPVIGISPDGVYKLVLAPSFQWLLWSGILLSIFGLFMHVRVTFRYSYD